MGQRSIDQGGAVVVSVMQGHGKGGRREGEENFYQDLLRPKSRRRGQRSQIEIV